MLVTYACFNYLQGVLKHNPIEELFRKVGAYPGPLDEVALWQGRLDKLHSINLQLDSPIAADILRNLDEASSTYAQSFQHVRKDITKVTMFANSLYLIKKRFKSLL